MLNSVIYQRASELHVVHGTHVVGVVLTALQAKSVYLLSIL